MCKDPEARNPRSSSDKKRTQEAGEVGVGPTMLGLTDLVKSLEQLKV